MSDIIVLTEDNFKKTIEENEIVLVDFYATWCGPCRKLLSIIEEVATELKGKVTVCKVDSGEYTSIAKEQEILTVPTLVLYKNGKDIGRLKGLKSKETIIGFTGV